jgi:hypothetical protein
MQPLGHTSSGFLLKFSQFFHLMALYSVVEFLLFGTMEFETQKSTSITSQVRWASAATDVRDRMIPMYSAVALLLTAWNNQDDGIFNVWSLTYV